MRTLLSSNVIWTWLVCFRRPGPCWNNLPRSCTHALLWLGMLPICKFCVGCNASYWTVDVTTLEFRDFLKIGSLFAGTDHCVATIDVWCALLAVVPHGLFSKLLLSVLSRGCCETLFSIVFFCVCVWQMSPLWWQTSITNLCTKMLSATWWTFLLPLVPECSQCQFKNNYLLERALITVCFVVA